MENTTTDDNESSLTEIELIERHDEPESQCGRCGYKYTRLWNLGEHEDEELAACGDCTVEVINAFEKYTLFEEMTDHERKQKQEQEHDENETENTRENSYTKPVQELTAGEALQRLYSYTESTGPDIGALIEDFRNEDVDATMFITQLNEDANSYRNPSGYDDTHFTDVVGEARIAADEHNTDTAIEIIDDTILPTLRGTQRTLNSIESDVRKLPVVSNETLSQLEKVINSYEYMIRLAMIAKNQLGT